MGTESGGTTSSSVASETAINNHLWSLVPTFDPSKDSLEIWTQKVELLVGAWPQQKLGELATRLILNCTGSAFQKLQLHKDELIRNDPKAIEKLVSYLGGQWGKVALEKRFEAVERALYHCTQKPDESNDSFLARADVMWSELVAKNLSMKEIQAYIILRGSQLSGDDKKRVLVESGAEADGALTQTRVNQAICMLGSSFFQDYVGFRKTKTKTYDSQTLVADAVNSEEGDNDIYAAEADSLDDSSWLEHLTQEGDPDAILVSEYETALSETVQEDNELASCYNAYVEARHRLTERFKSRGFWPIKGKGKSGKGFGKGKKGSKKSLEQRILSSTCRLCGQRGHWKAECPQRFSHNPSSSSSTGGVPTASTSFVDLSQDQSLPLEFMQLPSVHESTIDEPPPQLSSIVLFGDVSNMSVTMGIINRLRNRNLRSRTQAPAPLHDVHKPTIVRDDKLTSTSGSQSCFEPPI